MKLSLDKEALNALFPEGSEARIELSRVITLDLVKRLGISDVRHLSQPAQSAVRKVAQDELDRLGFKQGTYHATFVNESTKAAIRESVHKEFEEVVTKTRQAIIVSKEDEIGMRVRSAVETLIQYENRAAIKSLVKECLGEMLGRA